MALLLSMQRREPLFFFFLLIDTPFSVAALWQRWRGRPTVVLLFPSFFLCNFLSPRLLSVFFFVFSFPFCLLSLSSPPLCFCFPPSLSRSLSLLHCLSLAFISQGKPCDGNGCLVIWRQRDSNHKMCPIIGAICCKTYSCFTAKNAFL